MISLPLPWFTAIHLIVTRLHAIKWANWNHKDGDPICAAHNCYIESLINISSAIFTGTKWLLGRLNCFTFLQPTFTVFFVFFWVAFKKKWFRTAQMFNTCFITQKKDKVIHKWWKDTLFCNITQKKIQKYENYKWLLRSGLQHGGQWYQGISARITSVRSSVPQTSAQSSYQEHLL